MTVRVTSQPELGRVRLRLGRGDYISANQAWSSNGVTVNFSPEQMQALLDAIVAADKRD